MADYPNLSELKKKLQDFGISTSTPGLVGEDRYQELLIRFKAVQPQPNANTQCIQETDAMKEIKNLSMSEIRARLSALGMSTTTPGLTGEDRFNALLQRLISAISAEAAYNPKPVPSEIKENQKPIIVPEPTVEETNKMDDVEVEVEKEYSKVMEEVQQINVEPEIPALDLRDDINEMKKMIKKISNKRSMAIAAQLSGDQDKLLSEFSSLLSKVEADIAFCRSAISRCEHKISASILKSQLWKDKGQPLDIAMVQQKLESKREELKESIKQRRSEIRHAAENHPEYGLQVEEELKAELAQVQFTVTKVSRARRKLHDTKSLDNSIHSIQLNTQSYQDEKSERGSDSKGELQNPSIPPIFMEHDNATHSSSPSQDKDNSKGFLSARDGKQFSDVNSNSSVNSNSESYFADSKSSVKSKEKSEAKLQESPLVSKPVVSPIDSNSMSKEELLEKRRAYEIYLKTGQFPTKKSPTNTIVTPNSEPTISNSTSTPTHTFVPRKLNFVDISNAQPPEPRIKRSSIPSSSTIVHTRVQSTLDEETIRTNLEIEELLKHSSSLQKADDILAAEILLERALDMDPMNILVLQSIARFLHVKKGELARAEAFFNRALQIALPQLYSQLTSLLLQQRQLNLRFSQDVSSVISVLSPLLKKIETENNINSNNSTPVNHAVPASTSSPADAEKLKKAVEESSVDSRFRLPHVISLLLSFGKFLLKAKGDIDAAALLFQHSALLAPDHAECLANYAHFLSEYMTLKNASVALDEPDRLSIPQQIDSLFQRALQCAPGHSVYMMWYGKFLKKVKRLGPAEFMYRSAWETATRQHSAREEKLKRGEVNQDREDEEENQEEDQELLLHNQEATALCNYATFLFKYRPNKVHEAQQLFLWGLQKYPEHAGLRKNYQTLEKKLAKHPELLSKVKNDTADDQRTFAPIHPSDEVSTTSDVRPPQQPGSSDTLTDPSPLPTILETEDLLANEESHLVMPKKLSLETHLSSGHLDTTTLTSPLASPTRHGSSHGMLRSPIPAPNAQANNSRQPSRAGSSQVQSRGSRRAQRMQQSLALQLPTDLTTAEEKASFILERVRTANSSSNSSSSGGLPVSREHYSTNSKDSKNGFSNISVREGQQSFSDNGKKSGDGPSPVWNIEGVTAVSDHEEMDDDDSGKLHKQKGNLLHRNKKIAVKEAEEEDNESESDNDSELTYDEILKRRYSNASKVPLEGIAASQPTVPQLAHPKEKEIDETHAKPSQKKSKNAVIGSTATEMASLFHHSTNLSDRNASMEISQQRAKDHSHRSEQHATHRNPKKKEAPSKAKKVDDDTDSQILNIRINSSAMNGKL